MGAVVRGSVKISYQLLISGSEEWWWWVLLLQVRSWLDPIKHFPLHNSSSDQTRKNFHSRAGQTWFCCLAMGFTYHHSIVFSSSKRDSVPQVLLTSTRALPHRRINNHFVFTQQPKNSQVEKLPFRMFKCTLLFLQSEALWFTITEVTSGEIYLSDKEQSANTHCRGACPCSSVSWASGRFKRHIKGYLWTRSGKEQVCILRRRCFLHEIHEAEERDD